MQRIAIIMLVAVLCGASGCATSRRRARNALPAVTPYDTNATARAVYLEYYGKAWRIAAAGRSSITFHNTGEHVSAAADGQRAGVNAGVKILREDEIQRLGRKLRLPSYTRFDYDRKARAAYLKRYRSAYVEALAGHNVTACSPQGLLARAWAAGEMDGQFQAERDKNAVEQRVFGAYSKLNHCMVQQHPAIPCESASSQSRMPTGAMELFRKFIGW